MTCENAGSSPPARAGAFSFPRPSLISGLIGGSILVVFGAGRPQQATYSRGYVAPDRVSHVLVPRGHRRARPTHDGHDRLLWYTQDQKHRRRRMPGVVQTSISDPCALQQGLPGVVVRRSDGCGDPGFITTTEGDRHMDFSTWVPVAMLVIGNGHPPLVHCHRRRRVRSTVPRRPLRHALDWFRARLLRGVPAQQLKGHLGLQTSSSTHDGGQGRGAGGPRSYGPHLGLEARLRRTLTNQVQQLEARAPQIGVNIAI